MRRELHMSSLHMSSMTDGKVAFTPISGGSIRVEFSYKEWRDEGEPTRIIVDIEGIRPA